MRISVLYGHPFDRDIPIIGISLVVGISLFCRYPYDRDIPIIRISLLQGCPYYWDIPIIGISLLYGYTYHRDIFIIEISLLYGYPYNTDIPLWLLHVTAHRCEPGGMGTPREAPPPAHPHHKDIPIVRRSLQ